MFILQELGCFFKSLPSLQNLFFSFLRYGQRGARKICLIEKKNKCLVKNQAFSNSNNFKFFRASTFLPFPLVDVEGGYILQCKPLSRISTNTLYFSFSGTSIRTFWIRGRLIPEFFQTRILDHVKKNILLPIIVFISTFMKYTFKYSFKDYKFP